MLDKIFNGVFSLPGEAVIKPKLFLVCILAFAASLEELLIHLSRKDYRADRKSIFSAAFTTS